MWMWMWRAARPRRARRRRAVAGRDGFASNRLDGHGGEPRGRSGADARVTRLRAFAEAAASRLSAAAARMRPMHGWKRWALVASVVVVVLVVGGPFVYFH